MSKYKLRGVNMRSEGRRQILVATLAEVLPPCKKCQKNPRRHGSNTCEECSATNRLQKLNDNRLRQKIAEQTITK